MKLNNLLKFQVTITMPAENYIFVLLLTAVIHQPPESPYEMYCSATLIREDLALTAAHCFKNRLQYTKRVKILLLSGMVRNVEVKNVHIHPKYNVEDFSDVAILQFPSTEIAKSPTLPSKILPSPLQLCYSAGFGHKSPSLKSFKEISIPDPKVLFRMGSCIAVVYDKPTPCKGDSGGPLICNQTLIGVLSKGTSQSCSDEDALMIYENLVNHLDWVNTFFKLQVLPPPANIYFVLLIVAVVFFGVFFLFLILFMFWR